ncbi:MAG: helix-turn-helix transcriptional regulator [Bacteroidales bacterium]|nr:helix-turn-helix transcriptional regulator [Bacteroidales bacterium]
MKATGFKSFESIKDEFLGKTGTPERDQYEFDLQLDILGYMIKKTRKERNLTQKQLGELVGVEKSEISKLERSTRNMTISTVLKVFRAMKANIKFMVNLDDEELYVA